jgi:hypothetical protein
MSQSTEWSAVRLIATKSRSSPRERRLTHRRINHLSPAGAAADVSFSALPRFITRV